MKTIIFAHQKIKIGDHWITPAMMPVLDQPLIAYCLKSLVEAGVREVVISVGDHANMIEEYCEQGAKWGLQVSYLPVRSQIPAADVITNIICDPAEQLLVLDASYLWNTKNALRLITNEHNATSLLLVGSDQHVSAFIGCKGLFNWHRSVPAMELIVNELYALNSLSSYHQICMSMMNQRNESFDEQRTMLGNTLTHQSQIKLIASMDNCYLGKNSICSGNVNLRSSVLMSGAVVVKSNATRCVILPNTVLDYDAVDQIVGFNHFVKKYFLNKSIWLKIKRALWCGKIKLHRYYQYCIHSGFLNRTADNNRLESQLWSKKIFDQLYR